MASERAQPQQVRMQLDWGAAKAVEVQVATQIVAHLASPVGGTPDGVYLIVGDAPPPLVLGEDDETRQAELATYEGKLPVSVHGRYFVTRARLGEFIEVLQRAATLYDEASEGGTA